MKIFTVHKDLGFKISDKLIHEKKSAAIIAQEIKAGLKKIEAFESFDSIDEFDQVQFATEIDEVIDSINNEAEQKRIKVRLFIG